MSQHFTGKFGDRKNAVESAKNGSMAAKVATQKADPVAQMDPQKLMKVLVKSLREQFKVRELNMDEEKINVIAMRLTQVMTSRPANS